ncbi:NADPH-dependent FMN reductase [Paenibacillus radicis (ex Xue et al. 2023)]|uniref:NAD(P)H-dependent oxidoreductase n=1 Tax=Paenibacillus radicis (ex Xue et al. 2023) TaxID=2972489 RepID=A0ABT1Y9F2_9BACL|nr:NAD(P)H-dependent oxidoreductase [Paenibacillus radicis (ex Xue et al. 2023)]MCR8629808.1 NAD(P)H-dependent oxidoreductase [Paenibacillus radicis (ex Xue et al. 2023)]
MNIVIIAGGNRKTSTSTRLAEYIERLMLQKGHKVSMFDLYQSPLPFYSPDESFQEHADLLKLKRWLFEADGVVLATPEYHGGMSGVLKNALDHLGQVHFSGKPVLSVSSAGGAVGVSSLQQLQSIMRNLHGINAPEWISIGGMQRKWFETGQDSGYEGGQEVDDRIHRVLGSFLDLTQLVRGRFDSAGAGSSI